MGLLQAGDVEDLICDGCSISKGGVMKAQCLLCESLPHRTGVDARTSNA